MSKFNEIHTAGTSLWFDFIRRDLLEDGGLADLVAEGIRGVTSNPSIFQKAIMSFYTTITPRFAWWVENWLNI